MHPFQPPFRNQNPVRGGNYPFLNQFPRPSSALSNQIGLNNPQILTPTMGGVHNQSALLDSLLAQQQLIQQLQNNFIASLSQLVTPQLYGQQASLSQGVMPQLHGQQLNLLGGIHNPNLMSLQLGGQLGQPFLSHNLNQRMGISPNGFICSQNPNFTSNSQLPVMSYSNPNNLLLGYDKPRIAEITSTSTGPETQEGTKKLQKLILQSPVQNNQSSGLLGQPSLSQNLNQRMGFSPNGFLSSQNPNFGSNSQLPVMNYSNRNHLLLGYEKSQIGHMTSTSTGFGTHEVNQILQKPILQNPVQNKQSNGEQQTEMSHSRACRKDLTSNSSENVSINNLKNVSENREPSHTSSRNVGKKNKTFSGIEIGGKQQRNEKNTKISENNDNTYIKSSRAAIYNESEVQKWREARKKNFPTRAKVEKKLELSNSKKENVVEDGNTHLEELKEVLAKQAVLGIQYNLSDKKEQRFQHDNKNAKRRRFKRKTPMLMNHHEARTDPPVPEVQLSNMGANEASNKDTQIRQNRYNNKRGRFRLGKKNAKKCKVNEEAPVLVNHEEEGTHYSSGC